MSKALVAPTQTKIDDYSRHEALDRSFLLMDMIYQILVSHPYIQSQPKLQAHAEKAADQLNKVYQAIGREHLGS